MSERKTYNPTVNLSRQHFLSEEDWLRARLHGGTFTLRNGIRVGITHGVELADDSWGNCPAMETQTLIEGERDVEVVTVYADGSYSTRLD